MTEKIIWSPCCGDNVLDNKPGHLGEIIFISGDGRENTGQYYEWDKALELYPAVKRTESSSLCPECCQIKFGHQKKLLQE